MKKVIVLLNILLLLFTSNCKQGVKVTFTSPQPIDTKDLNKFPTRLFGEYLSNDEVTRLRISKKMIEKIYDYQVKLHPNELDSNCVIKDDYIIDLKTKEKLFFKRVNDSLEINVFFIDTIFNLNNEDILRKYKGSYFLNMKYEDNAWEVQKLHLKKGKLYLGVITNESEISYLKEISESYEDTIPTYNFKIEKKQFKEFILNEGFSSTDTLIKIKK
jgi:hypothetical protein